MGFFASGTKNQVSQKARVSDNLLHTLGCRGCSLNKVDLINPKIEPSGSTDPIIYLIGEAPSTLDDRDGRHFSDDAGSYIRKQLPREFRSEVRLSNTIRCMPPDGRRPDKVEIECCRTKLEGDINNTQPSVIFGFGDIPLVWAQRPSPIEMWRGRRFPVKVENTTYWYYAFMHPKFFLDTDDKRGWRKSDNEVAFEHDMRRACAEIKAGLPKPVVHTTKEARSNIVCIEGRSSQDLKTVLSFLDYAATAEIAGVDYEATHLRPYSKDFRILSAAVSVEEDTLAFGWNHPHAGWSPSQLKKLQDAWLRFLLSPARKVSHNLSYEMEVTCYLFGNRYARDVTWEDSLTAAFSLDERIGETKPGALSLEFLVLQEFGLNIKRMVGLNKARMIDEPLSAMLPYNAVDAKYHRLVFGRLEERLRKEKLIEVYREKLEQIPTVVLTQIKGFPVDAEVNEKLSKEYEQKIAAARRIIETLPDVKTFQRITGNKFNPLSGPDMVVMLRDILKDRTGQPGPGWSTTKEVLKAIKSPIGQAVITLRETQKLKSTYVDPFSVNSPLVFNNTLHASFGTCYTETGRLQCEDPNLQNVPVRSKEGKRVRSQIQKRGGIFAKFDQGQIDARMIACASRDPTYCRALWEDYDIHLEWAKRLAKHNPDWVGGKAFIEDAAALKDFRGKKVKNDFVFALFYTASLHTTAHRFGVEDDVMEPMYDAFWKQFSLVKKWQNTLIEQFDELGYVQLLGGLRRHAPLGRGQIVNTPIQSATNRIVMDAMNRLSKMGDPRLQPNLQLHDDLSFIFDTEKDFEECTPIILDSMLDGSAFPWICVPLSVEVEYGPTWADTKSLGTYNSVQRLGWPIREKEFM